MKGRYNLMIYVGIDIAKLNRFAPAISSDRLTEHSYADENIIIGLKSMAHYGENLIRYLVSCNYNMCVEPHQNLGHEQT